MPPNGSYGYLWRVGGGRTWSIMLSDFSKKYKSTEVICHDQQELYPRTTAIARGAVDIPAHWPFLSAGVGSWIPGHARAKRSAQAHWQPPNGGMQWFFVFRPFMNGIFQDSCHCSCRLTFLFRIELHYNFWCPVPCFTRLALRMKTPSGFIDHHLNIYPNPGVNRPWFSRHSVAEK